MEVKIGIQNVVREVIIETTETAAAVEKLVSDAIADGGADAFYGGETGELIFSPLVPGAYSFRCDFHPDQMGGRIEVQSGIP